MFLHKKCENCFLALIINMTLISGQASCVSWIEQPSDKNVTVGSNVTFPCKIVMEPNITFIWNQGTRTLFYNGQRAANVPERYTVIGDASQGRNDLRIINVQEEDESMYSCQAFPLDAVQTKLTVLCKEKIYSCFG